jgi:glycosyltransferase involved in cell wall biosynthesis
MKKYPSLSVCMIVKDEEDNLPGLLASIKGLADELVIVDTGSKDATVDVAGRSGAKVYHFPWCDDFSAARNESLCHATKDFILWLDADDELKREDHQRIRAHLRRHPGAAAYLRVYMEGNEQTEPCPQLRIFPNHKGIRFEGRVHEQVYDSAVAKGILVHTCNAAVLHHGYEAPGALMEKLRRNRKLLEEELACHPGDLNALYFSARTCLGLDELESAVAHLDAIIERGKDDPLVRAHSSFKQAIINKGIVLLILGRAEEAFSVASYGKLVFPQFALNRFLLGTLHLERKEYEEAFDELLPLKDKSLEKETMLLDIPDMEKWFCRALGVSALFMDDLSVAEECFKAQIDGDPSDKATYHYLALTRERKGDMEGAAAACRLGLERAGDDRDLRKRLFFLLVTKEDLGQAVECYETLHTGKWDVDTLAGRFLLSCRALDGEGIQLYYRLLQERLSVEPLDFPQNLQVTMGCLQEGADQQSVKLFDTGVKFLLAQAS